LLKVRAELSNAPVLLLIFTFVFPEIVITPVKVMSLTTLTSASLVIALDRAEKEDTSVLSRRRPSNDVGTGGDLVIWSVWPLVAAKGPLPSTCPLLVDRRPVADEWGRVFSRGGVGVGVGVRSGSEVWGVALGFTLLITNVI